MAENFERFVEVELPTGEVVEFPADMSEEQMTQATLQYLQNIGQVPEDVPEFPPEGGRFQRTPIESQFMEDLPALAGSIAVPLIASRFPAVQNMTPAMQRLTMIAASGAGGAIGETGAVAMDVADNELSEQRKTAAAIGERIVMKGAEMAAFEGIGQLALKTGSWALSPLKPKVSQLTKGIATKFKESGGQLSLPQLTDAWWVHQLEGLSRGSLTGSGVFKRLDVRNTQAFKVMEDKLVDTIAKKSSGNLSDQEIGQLFVNVVNNGRAAHSNAAGVMYNELDDLLVQRSLRYTTPSSLMTKAKQSIDPTVFVKTTGLKDTANAAIAQLERTAKVGSGEFDTTLLRNVSNLSNTLSFHDAHFLRSNLLLMQRDLEGVVGAGRAKKLIGELVKNVDESMEDAAKKGGKEIYDTFRRVDKFWRRGKETFDNKFIAKLINADKTNPERIGEILFRDGNVSDIVKAKKALRTSSKLDKTLDADTIWGDMQAGYLKSLLGKTSDAEGVVSANRLLKAFVDRKRGRTLAKVFSKEQRDRIIEFATIGERLQRSPEGGLGLVMNLAQAGTIIDVAQAPFTGFRVFDPVEATTILVAPSVMARALTSPKITDMMIRATRTKASTSAGKQLATKLSAEFAKLKLLEESNQELQEE